MSFTSESILKTFKNTEVADAPKLKHTQYLHYLARRLGYLDYATSNAVCKRHRLTVLATSIQG